MLLSAAFKLNVYWMNLNLHKRGEEQPGVFVFVPSLFNTDKMLLLQNRKVSQYTDWFLSFSLFILWLLQRMEFPQAATLLIGAKLWYYFMKINIKVMICVHWMRACIPNNKANELINNIEVCLCVWPNQGMGCKCKMIYTTFKLDL